MEANRKMLNVISTAGVNGVICTRANTNVLITTGAWLLRHQLMSASRRRMKRNVMYNRILSDGWKN